MVIDSAVSSVFCRFFGAVGAVACCVLAAVQSDHELCPPLFFARILKWYSVPAVNPVISNSVWDVLVSVPATSTEQDVLLKYLIT